MHACRGLAARGLVPAAAGNASVAVGEHVLLTAHRRRVRRAGRRRPGARRPSRRGRGRRTGAPDLGAGAAPGGVRARPDVGAVVHTHGRHAVALSTVTAVVPALHYYALDLGGPVPVAPYRTYGTDELAEVTVGALAGRPAVVMAHHGSTTVGGDAGRRRPPAPSCSSGCARWRCSPGPPGEPAELTRRAARGGARGARRRAAGARMTVFIALGPHILDVLGRPVTDDPRRAGRRPARGAPDHRGRHGRRDGRRPGPAGRHGAQRRRDRRRLARRRFLRLQLEAVGVDTSRLVVRARRADVLDHPADPAQRRAARRCTCRGATPLLTARRTPRPGRRRARGHRLPARRRARTCSAPSPQDVLPGLLRGARAAGTVVSTDLLASAQGGALRAPRAGARADRPPADQRPTRARC